LDTGATPRHWPIPGIGLYGQIEYVQALDNTYNDGGTRTNADSLSRAIIADPESFAFKQMNIRFEGAQYPNTSILRSSLLRVGRQEITHRADPLQRFAGNVAFRQHFQVYDGLRFTNRSVGDLVADYAYIWDVHTVFGPSNSKGKGNAPLDGHLINLRYDGFRDRGGRPWAKAEGYGYLLDFQRQVNPEVSDAAQLTSAYSSQTYGARLELLNPLLHAFDALNLEQTWLFRDLDSFANLEYAHQWSYGSNTNLFSHDYFLGELGLTYLHRTAFESATLSFGYEVLGGEGTGKAGKNDQFAAFQTPLGTNHAFQGFADRFLITPRDGIHDLFVTMKSTVRLYNSPINLSVIYHDFSADAQNYRYGTEWNLVAEWSPFSFESEVCLKCKGIGNPNVRKWAKNLVLGAQYAKYQAAGGQPASNHGLANLNLDADVDKFWLFVQWKID
jgi:hypothetical protein